MVSITKDPRIAFARPPHWLGVCGVDSYLNQKQFHLLSYWSEMYEIVNRSTHTHISTIHTSNDPNMLRSSAAMLILLLVCL